MKLKHVYHLYNRAGFGIGYEEAQELEKLTKKEVVDKLFEASKKIDYLDLDIKELKQEIRLIVQNTSGKREIRKQVASVLKENKGKLKELNKAWVERLQTTDAVLRERMTLFWANHFVCHDKNIIYFKRYQEVLRTNALGNFKDFVISISKEPSMQKYLNLRQNKKSSPNENFARELMELFTLGRDQLYTEKDIKEAAKAFTGWSHDLQGDFKLRNRQHDIGEKIFIGKKGNWDGEDIIEMITTHKECARFICKKLYTYFVNDKPNETHITEMIAVFYPSYDIEKVMKHIFLSSWFYQDENIGVKIKSPIDVLVGIGRTIPIAYQKPKELMYLQKLLGQVLLFPPNVAGWSGGQDWINANTLMLRLKLPALLLNQGVIALEEKRAFEDDFEKFNKKKNRNKRLHVEANWEAFEKIYSNKHRQYIQEMLLPQKLSSATQKHISSLTTTDLKSFCIQLMSIPEYQMC
ncbi:DUF1800 domain-containing protein [Aquimarina rhabdastrellae]